MNILILGKPYNNLIKAIQGSRNLDKLYTAANETPIDGIPNIEFYSLKELVRKIQGLQIDLTILTDKDLIDDKIAEFFKQNRINLLSVNEKWLNLEKSKLAAKQLLNHYSINTPQIIKVPTEFPVVLKTNSSEIIVNSITELTEKMELCEEKPFIEERLEGESAVLTALWDGKNIYYFNIPSQMNEVKEDRLNLLKTKLNFLFSDEKADFMGFFTINLIWAKNDWYVKDFNMGINEKSALAQAKTDFLYILNLAIYQNLNQF